MRLSKTTAEIFVPDGLESTEALQRTSHMGIAAHQDDLEIMAIDGILACFHQPDKWFLGVVVSDGAGSPRGGIYANYSPEEMRAIRRTEQKKAAFVGEYGAAVFLDYPSAEIRSVANSGPGEDIQALIAAARPQIIYTHNLADKHDTHVAVALRTIAAIRRLDPEIRPCKLFGCEVWRGLDWMSDEDKVVFALDRRENIAMTLVGIFDSQIAGGKRYDMATMGRLRANATYYESHKVDAGQSMHFAMDLTPLIENDDLDANAYVQRFIDRLAQDVARRIGKLS
jgi:LmbE family N-acetylglucosaminyl deacetylase